MAQDTPVVVGVGQFAERLEDENYVGLSPLDLAVEASRQALGDAGIAVDGLKSIDLVAAVRQFEISLPQSVAPFGCSNNFPRSVAKRLGVQAKSAQLEMSGGQSPQALLTKTCRAIGHGQIQSALLVGAEAISTVGHLTETGETPDWSDQVNGSLEDAGFGLEGVTISPYEMRHKIVDAPTGYALLEHARRGRLGMAKEEYASSQMAALLARFSEIASKNEFAFVRNRYSAEEISTVDARNRMICDPYPLRMVARDKVNQSAAVLVTSVETAKSLGIEESKFVYLHGYSDLRDCELLKRPDLSRSRIGGVACSSALSAAAIDVDDVSYFDFYSCFPVSVLAVLDELDLEVNDLRPFTLTGGLPYFGGPGNNYSMHAIAEMVSVLRTDAKAFGLVGANGGFMSKYSAGVFSCRPVQWNAHDDASIQRRLDEEASVPVLEEAEGKGRIETYTVRYQKGEARHVLVTGRLDSDRSRFLALCSDESGDVAKQFLEDDFLGAPISVCSTENGNRFSF